MWSNGFSKTNFAHLQNHEEQLVRLGTLAERYFADDPNTCIIKLRQFAELLVQLTASQTGLFTSTEERQHDLLRRLDEHGILPVEVFQLFGEVHRAGNAAMHSTAGDHHTALTCIRICWQLSIWFHRTFLNTHFQSGPFIPPLPPINEIAAAEPKVKTERSRSESETNRESIAQRSDNLATDEENLGTVEEERAFREQMASEVEMAKTGVQQRLVALQLSASTLSNAEFAQFINASRQAAQALELDEADTRQLIDRQLRAAGWTADSVKITYVGGARPQKGRSLAIAEWPTASGPADYVLFVGLKPMAVIEAKRKNIDVSGALQQAKRYSRGFQIEPEHESPGGPWEEYKIPFVFSANGRPFLRQISTHSGVWFCDLRLPDNLSQALDGWYTPEGLAALLKKDIEEAHRKLASEPMDYDLILRPYQQAAILAIEAGIAESRREMLVAMATGTGKTKTCIALIYRLLKAQRFRRVLFLVDRSALGEQAANAFKDTRLENLQTFANIFGIKDLDDQSPDTDTSVHIATVQSMVRRILYPDENATPPSVDQYDCIAVDECHRGYLLDRELSDTELTFRGFDDYISKYRRVLDYFDAVKIGLTATPALHTTQIFGPPIFTYSYREAVIDGYLVDHEPPVQIKTQLSEGGITWKVGEEVQVYNARRNQIDLFTTPDEIRIEVEDFNRKVITEPFNQVVCSLLAQELDPASRQKTLIFCANDSHADLVVKLLKEAFQNQYGSIEDDAVIKITGSADKPLQLIRRYKNERNPNVAVTVDLLTTGIDVPVICNLVFLRCVNSRILFDQMLGRATRLCDEIGKETFRIFDAVKIYEALTNMTAMQPVVMDPKITFAQLARELIQIKGDEERQLVCDQLITKLQRKKHRMSEKDAGDFETVAGMQPDAFIAMLHKMSLADIAVWFSQNQGLAEVLDRKGEGADRVFLISEHKDHLLSVDHGYGKARKPEDYLQEFAEFIRSRSNSLPALMTVLTRPKDLTRRQLRELALELDKAGFSEASLATAWREMTNQDIAARIVGYIRQAAIGDALIPFEARVDSALQRILASRPWTTPQRQWLQKIAAQTRANLVVDREALDDPDLIFRREGGGFTRLNRIFGGQLQQVLESFNDSLWRQDAA